MKCAEVTVSILRSRPGLGHGLFATSDIAKGDFVAEYTGKRISTREADSSKSRYLFEIDGKWTIDGSPRSNVARYINHSCEPNSEANICGSRIYIYAIRDIEAGEEITMDYGEEYFDEFIRPKGCRCSHCFTHSR